MVDAAQLGRRLPRARDLGPERSTCTRGNRVVIVKLAADQKNFDPRFKLDYIDYLQALAQSLED